MQGQILNQVAHSEIKNLACTTKLAVFYLDVILLLPVSLRMHVFSAGGLIIKKTYKGFHLLIFMSLVSKEKLIVRKDHSTDLKVTNSF